jgi:hypothetical protein
MKLKLYLLQIAFLLAASLAWGQGTYVYDQQTTTGDVAPYYGAGRPIDFFDVFKSPWGQSFTPSLDTVGFIAIPMDDYTGGFGSATVWVNLMSGSVTGPVIASSEPVYLTAGFSGTYYFIFSTPVPVTPGVQYFFVPQEAGGSTDANIITGEYSYPGAAFYANGIADPRVDLLFREGTIITPEPSSVVLLLLGGGALALFRRVKGKPKSRQPRPL